MNPQVERTLQSAWFTFTHRQPLGAGRINDTFILQDKRGQRFVLQRLNPRVFTNPKQSMVQTSRVVAHLNRKHPGWVPSLVSTQGGEQWVEDLNGDVWRLWRYVDNAVALEANTPCEGHTLVAAGAAFARTQTLLSDLPPPPLIDPIEGHHQLSTQIRALDAHDGYPLIEDVEACRVLAECFTERTGYVHGDCKLGNLLFTRDLTRVCAVLDLDTVMHGHWAWDFGDLARSCATTDEGFNLDRFAAAAEGFLSQTSHNVGAKDMALAPQYVTATLAIRYLLDHLSGDRHFKVEQHGDNLTRAKMRFALLRTMRAQHPQTLACCATLIKAAQG